MAVSFIGWDIFLILIAKTPQHCGDRQVAERGQKIAPFFLHTNLQKDLGGFRENLRGLVTDH